jgi:UPF0176 protein
MRSLGLEVFQLDGGILNYLQQAQEEAESGGAGGDESADRMQTSCEPKNDARAAAPNDLLAAWQGECFVFDRRIALDAQLSETGTTAEQVFDPAHPDEAWRLQRARRLDEAA